METRLQSSDGRTPSPGWDPHPSYLFMITVVAIQLVKVRGTL